MQYTCDVIHKRTVCEDTIIITYRMGSMRKFFIALIILLTLCIFAACLSACSNSGSHSDYTSNSDFRSKKTMSERERIAEEAVAKYINDYMRRACNSGRYSVIDYNKMRYTASASLVNGNVFNVSIKIYHYSSLGEYVGKNSHDIKASAEVDEYGNVSNVQAKSFGFVDWD